MSGPTWGKEYNRAICPRSLSLGDVTLTDTQYQQVQGVNMAGRTVVFGLDYVFKKKGCALKGAILDQGRTSWIADYDNHSFKSSRRVTPRQKAMELKSDRTFIPDSVELADSITRRV